jgi:hypothetical protein
MVLQRLLVSHSIIINLHHIDFNFAMKLLLPAEIVIQTVPTLQLELSYPITKFISSTLVYSQCLLAHLENFILVALGKSGNQHQVLDLLYFY